MYGKSKLNVKTWSKIITVMGKELQSRMFDTKSVISLYKSDLSLLSFLYSEYFPTANRNNESIWEIVVDQTCKILVDFIEKKHFVKDIP